MKELEYPFDSEKILKNKIKLKKQLINNLSKSHENALSLNSVGGGGGDQENCHIRW